MEWKKLDNCQVLHLPFTNVSIYVRKDRSWTVVTKKGIHEGREANTVAKSKFAAMKYTLDRLREERDALENLLDKEDR